MAEAVFLKDANFGVVRPLANAGEAGVDARDIEKCSHFDFPGGYVE